MTARQFVGETRPLDLAFGADSTAALQSDLPTARQARVGAERAMVDAPDGSFVAQDHGACRLSVTRQSPLTRVSFANAVMNAGRGRAAGADGAADPTRARRLLGTVPLMRPIGAGCPSLRASDSSQCRRSADRACTWRTTVRVSGCNRTLHASTKSTRGKLRASFDGRS
jgi:hypothetical protein